MGGLAGLLQQYGSQTGNNLITGAPLSPGNPNVGGGFGGMGNIAQGLITPAAVQQNPIAPSSTYLSFINALHPAHRTGLVNAFSSHPDFGHMFRLSDSSIAE